MHMPTNQRRGFGRSPLWTQRWHQEMWLPRLCSPLQSPGDHCKSGGTTGLRRQPTLRGTADEVQTCGLFPRPSYADRTPDPGTVQICSCSQGCQSPGAEAVVSTVSCKAATRGCCTNLPGISGLEAMVHLCYITEAFFFMQLLLQHCPAISDYYGGWKTLLFLTAGSRLNGLKRIFGSSCFREASQTVVTTAKAVRLCFGDSAFLHRWYCLALSNERLGPFSLNVVNYLLPFIQTMQQQLSKRYLSII